MELDLTVLTRHYNTEEEGAEAVSAYLKAMREKEGWVEGQGYVADREECKYLQESHCTLFNKDAKCLRCNDWTPYGTQY